MPPRGIVQDVEALVKARLAPVHVRVGLVLRFEIVALVVVMLDADPAGHVGGHHHVAALVPEIGLAQAWQHQGHQHGHGLADPAAFLADLRGGEIIVRAHRQRCELDGGLARFGPG